MIIVLARAGTAATAARARTRLVVVRYASLAAFHFSLPLRFAVSCEVGGFLDGGDRGGDGIGRETIPSVRILGLLAILCR